MTEKSLSVCLDFGGMQTLEPLNQVGWVNLV